MLYILKIGSTVMILTILKEQSDQGLHCLPFHVQFLDPLLCRETILSKFYDNYNRVLGVGNFGGFTVFSEIITGIEAPAVWLGLNSRLASNRGLNLLGGFFCLFFFFLPLLF